MIKQLHDVHLQSLIMWTWLEQYLMLPPPASMMIFRNITMMIRTKHNIIWLSDAISHIKQRSFNLNVKRNNNNNGTHTVACRWVHVTSGWSPSLRILHKDRSNNMQKEIYLWRYVIRFRASRRFNKVCSIKLLTEHCEKRKIF